MLEKPDFVILTRKDADWLIQNGDDFDGALELLYDGSPLPELRKFLTVIA